MAKYNYYAKFEKEETLKGSIYNVTFPDLENVFTVGDSLQHAMIMAEDVLAMMLTFFEDENIPFAAPSTFAQLKDDVEEETSVILIEVDTDVYRKDV